jgi:hypothetical protein
MRAQRSVLAALVGLLGAVAAAAAPAPEAPAGMRLVPGGRYAPFYPVTKIFWRLEIEAARHFQYWQFRNISICLIAEYFFQEEYIVENFAH